MKIFIILALIALNLISFLWIPILLPPNVITSIVDSSNAVRALDGFLPVTAIFSSIAFALTLELGIAFYKFGKFMVSA